MPQKSNDYSNTVALGDDAPVNVIVKVGPEDPDTLQRVISIESSVLINSNMDCPITIGF